MSQLAQTRPRSASEIVDASFRFYRARFGDLLVVSALLLVPPALLAAVAPDWLALPIKFVGNLMYLIAEGAVAILVAASLERSETLSAGDVFRALGRQAGTVIAVSIVSGLMVMLGSILLVVPGIIAAAWTTVALPVAAIEGLSSGASITRSRELARGRMGHVLGTMLLVWLIAMALCSASRSRSESWWPIGLPGSSSPHDRAARDGAALPAGRRRGDAAVLRPARPQRRRGRQPR